MDKKDLRKIIGKRVQEIRENIMHMTKTDFAKLIGMKNQYLGTVENGTKGLTLEKAIEICNKTGVSADYLLLGINNPIKTQIHELLEEYNKEEIDKSLEILGNLLPLFK